MAFLNKIKEKAIALKNIIVKFVKDMIPVVDEKAHQLKDWVIKFIKKSFIITSSKKSKITGIVFLFVTLIWVVLSVKTFTSMESSGKWVLLATALACPFIIGLNITFTIRIKNDIINKIWHLLSLFLLPILTIVMTEALNNIFIYDMTYLGFWGNYLVILIMYFIFFALTGSLKVAYIVVPPILYGFALAHSYIMDFRGTPFIPMDFLSVTTAAGVASTYNFVPNYKVIMGTFVFIFIMTLAFKTKTPNFHIATKIISRTFTAAFSTVLLTIFFATSFFADMGVKPDFWNQTRGYKNYGFVFSFFSNTKYLYMSEPNEYDPDSVQDDVDQTIDEDTEKVPTKKTPNIICIMNETLSDLRVLGDLQTNQEFMPYLDSLTENTVRGNLYVPVIGAGTSNTEFEFLTGHTTAFLPSGSNAYMLYIKNHIASLVSTMESQGYSSWALHPYYRDGWKRPEVYKNLGFNSFFALEDILGETLTAEFRANGSNPDYLQQLIDQHFPGSNMLLRQYVSDKYNYDLLIKDFENRDKSKPYFAFNVTMQNHGGYTIAAQNFPEEVYATNTSKAFPKANKYLSLIKRTDDAFKELIGYFSRVKEPTVICMFGDHQPSIETKFVEEIIGTKIADLTPEQEQSRYCTPFYIWANYDIEEKTVERLSSNYLSSLVLETAGVKLTKYNQYLLKLAETLPVINNAGYIDKDGNYYKWSDESPYSNILDKYEKIQYNNIFDRENVNLDIFYIDGEIPEQPEETEEVTND